MPQRISRGAPAKYAHYGLVEKEPKQTNKISCSKCIFYLDTDKTCSKRKLFMPEAGYDQWKYCNKLQLTKEFDTPKINSYVDKVQASVKKRAGQHNVTVKTKGILKLKNVMSGVITVYEISNQRTGSTILHPSDALVIKAQQSKSGKAFSWQGKTYKVIK